jgi:hypothetical protein
MNTELDKGEEIVPPKKCVYDGSDVEWERIDDQDEPELDVDDRAACKGCGRPVSDGEWEDNHGYCGQCVDEHEVRLGRMPQ